MIEIVVELEIVASVTAGEEAASYSKLHSSGFSVFPHAYSPEEVLRRMVSPAVISMAFVKQVNVP